ncbi:MAG: polysaccharide biosynthesis tyrosine autokinase [Acidobacteriota bacterium]|nr:MAG: polysaccharide biosynthesis tyrosine autokinase [Acidobacteriota bacterium]
MSQQENQQEFNLRDYWQILVRRRWLIYTCLLVTTVAATVSSFIAVPVFRATSVVAIERSGVRILRNNLTSAEPSWLDYQNWYNTQYRIIGSDAVLGTAIETMDLTNRPDALGRDPGEERSSLSLGEIKAALVRAITRSTPAVPKDELLPYMNALRGGLSINPVRDSHLVEISFVDRDPNFAAEVANAIAEAYMRFTLGQKLQLAEQSRDWFIDRIADLKDEVADAEFELQDYARRNGIVVGETGEVTRKNLDEVRQKHTQAQVNLGQARAKLETVKTTSPEALDDVIENQLIRELTRDLANDESQYQKLLAQYGSDFPEAVKLRAGLKEKRQQLEQQIAAIARQTIDSAQAAFEKARREEAQLASLLAQSKRRVDTLDRAMVEYSTRDSELNRRKQTLDDLITRLNDMELSATLGDTAHNVSIIDEAKPPRIIHKPKKKLNIMLGFLLGLFIGIGAAVVMEYVDNTIKSPEDVRAVLGSPVLGMVPSIGSLEKERSRAERRAAESPLGEIDPALLTARMPLSPIAESYRELRTAVLLATAGHPPRDLTVTSCQPSEGKTTTAVNLAIALAQLGRNILVVDTDLRRPRCHDVLSVPHDQGVSTYLTGMSELSALVLPTEIDRLSVVPAGPIPPNPAELLDSQRFLELVAELRGREEYDHVIFDSPPVLSVVDPLLIGRQTEGTVLVLRSAFTSREAGRLGKEKLEKGRVSVLGIVLNAVKTEHVPYQYRYYRYGYAREGREKTRTRRRAAASAGREG